MCIFCAAQRILHGCECQMRGYVGRPSFTPCVHRRKCAGISLQAEPSIKLLTLSLLQSHPPARSCIARHCTRRQADGVHKSSGCWLCFLRCFSFLLFSVAFRCSPVVCVFGTAFSPSPSSFAHPLLLLPILSFVSCDFFPFALFSISTMEQFSNQFVKIKIAHKWFKHTMGDCVRLFILWAPHTHSTQHTYTQTSHQYVRGNAAWSTGYARTPCEESGNSESVCGCEMRRFGRIYLFQLFLELFFILLVSLPLVFGFSAILLYLRL